MTNSETYQCIGFSLNVLSFSYRDDPDSDWLRFCRANLPAVTDLCTNLCDMWIPMVSLDLAPAPNWFAGVMGVTSTFTAAWSLLDPEARRIKPAN